MVVFITIFLLLLVAYFWLISYYHRAWNRIPEFICDKSRHRELPSADSKDFRISVIIASRNEESTIETALLNLLSQQYEGCYEIICIDDHSDDRTWDKLSLLASQHQNVRILQLPEGNSGKKKCIETGIKFSTGTHIVTTDADCEVPPYWLATIAAFVYDTRAKFVAGPVAMSSPYSVVGIFQRLDFITMQGITGASVFTGLHSMCNGANLAYEKAVFEEVGGFGGIDHIPSGDDMLLMQKVMLKYPKQVFYLKSKDAIVVTAAEPNWTRFFNQRIRWASKATHYGEKKIFYALLLTYLVNLCFVVFAVLLTIDFRWGWIFSLFLLMKIVVEYPFASEVAAFFRQQSLMIFLPFLQPLHIVYIVVSGWLGKFGSYRWKSRIIQNNARANAAKQ